MCNGKSYHIWASTQENFGGLQTTKAKSDQRLCYSIIYTFRLKTIVITSPELHVIFNIESDQSVNRPVTLATKQRFYVASTPILRRLTCDEIFRRLSQGKQTSAHLLLGQDEAILTPMQRFDVAPASILRRFRYVMRLSSFFHLVSP